MKSSETLYKKDIRGVFCSKRNEENHYSQLLKIMKQMLRDMEIKMKKSKHVLK